MKISSKISTKEQQKIDSMNVELEREAWPGHKITLYIVLSQTLRKRTERNTIPVSNISRFPTHPSIGLSIMDPGSEATVVLARGDAE